MKSVSKDNEFGSYNDYVSLEWERFEADEVRYKSLSDSIGSTKIRRVLDIGCGAGQEMLPFIEKGAFGVGVDVTPFVGQIGMQKFGEKGLQNQVSFINASGNKLPFADESFDVVICRGALMFMNVKMALSEMSRVLSKNGHFFLKIQAPKYYFWKMNKGLKQGEIKSAIHASRVLLSGVWFSFSGKQSYNRLTAGGETFVSRNTVKRDIKEFNLEIIGEMPDTNAQTPSFIIKKVK